MVGGPEQRASIRELDETAVRGVVLPSFDCDVECASRHDLQRYLQLVRCDPSPPGIVVGCSFRRSKSHQEEQLGRGFYSRRTSPGRPSPSRDAVPGRRRTAGLEHAALSCASGPSVIEQPLRARVRAIDCGRKILGFDPPRSGISFAVRTSLDLQEEPKKEVVPLLTFGRSPAPDPTHSATVTASGSVWNCPVLTDTARLAYASRERMVFVDAKNASRIPAEVPV